MQNLAQKGKPRINAKELEFAEGLGFEFIRAIRGGRILNVC